MLVILALASFGFDNPRPAYACSCAGLALEQRLELSDAVFSGTLVRKDAAGGNVFDVGRTWKGELPDGYVFSGFFGMCGTEFEIGKRYLVFAEQSNGTMTTSLCSGNLLLEQAGGELEALERLTGSARRTGGGGMALLATATAVVAAAAAMLAIRRSRRPR